MAVKYLKAVNVPRRTELGRRIRVASSFIDRAVGLLATDRLPPGGGLWIASCRSVHTFFMRYPIDVLFLGAHGVVIDGQTLRPWRISRWHLRSRGVLELAAGTIHRTRTRPGDRIEMKGAS